jgi:hypothetical protein
MQQKKLMKQSMTFLLKVFALKDKRSEIKHIEN